MKHILPTLLVLFLVLTSSHSQATATDKDFNIFGAAGSGFGLGSARMGYADWELGLLNSRTFGVAKLIRKENLYVELGTGFVAAPTSGFGILGGLGFEWDLWWIFNLRGGMNIVAGHTGQVVQDFFLGVDIRL